MASARRPTTKLLKDPNQPLLNHAISEQFPPARPTSSSPAGGLADGKITAHDEDPDGRLPVHRALHAYYDWNHRGFGAITIYDGFGHSSDTFFYQVAGMLGIDRLAYWAHE